MDARTQANRSKAEIAPLHIRFGVFELDEAEARLMRDGTPLNVPPKAFALLCALARQPGRLMTKDTLLDVVWGHQFVSESVLKTTVSELRAVLDDDVKQPRYIETASRRGYRFIGAITVAVAVPTRAPGAASVAGSGDAESAAPIVGRETYLARLSACWNRACSGTVQIVWIAGEAGIGKTTLIDAFAARTGAIVEARGQCVEQYGSAEPYLPVLEALSTLCRGDAALPPLLRAVAPTWALQLPWLSTEAERDALRREVHGASQERMLRELGELFERYTAARSLLLVTEDLHWSDHATVHLINHIARRRGRMQLMWLASFRLAEVISQEHPLKALRHELRLHKLCEEILLDPFSEQELADYLAARLPQGEVAEPFVRALHRRTDGLPLFVANVLDDLLMRGVLDPQRVAEEADLAQTAVPESLAGVMEKQIARLPAELQSLLQAASVCGVEFRPATVAAALDCSPDWATACCEDLARRLSWLGAVVAERLPDGTLDARCSFRHALYRHVFYQGIGAVARTRLHRRVAESLAQSRAAGAAVAAAELAWHFELGQQPAQALQHYAEAAETALRRFAPQEAGQLAQRALTSLLTQVPAGAARDALELALSTLAGAAAVQLTGVSALEAKYHFERARELLESVPMHPLRGLVLNGLGIVLMARGEYASAQALAERTHELSDGGRDLVLFLSACNVISQVFTLSGRQHLAQQWLERGIACCESLGEGALRAAFLVDPAVTLYSTQLISLLQSGRVERAVRQSEFAIERARRLGEPMAQMVAAWFGALFAVRLHDVERVARMGEFMQRVADDAGLAHGQVANRWFRGWAIAQQGDPLAGFALIRDAQEHNSALGMVSGSSEVLGYAAETLVLAHDWDGAQAQLDAALQIVQRHDERVYLPQLLLLQARIADGHGRAADARRARTEALAEAKRQDAAWLRMLVLTALCERREATRAQTKALGQILAALEGGADTVPVLRARASLASLGPT